MRHTDIFTSPTRTACLIILILPFLMFHWMIPFVSDQTLGNDYPRFSIDHQMELMFSLKTGSFPLYVPGFAGGQSANALTQAQIFHPMSHLASLMPGYWNGKALEWNTLLRLLSLAAAHLAVFAFLRKLKLGHMMAFLLSAVTVYHLRMLDLFRYGASLESWTGHLFLCVSVGWYCLKPTRVRGPLLIIGSTYYLVCSGHPQMMYYGLLGAGLFTLVIPYFLAALSEPDDRLGLRTPDIRTALGFWMRAGLCMGAGILLSSAYILPFYFDFVATNAGRVGRGYNWADVYRDTVTGTLNNFFYPLRSDVHGVFGGSSLFLAAALAPMLRFFRAEVPRVVWVILGLMLIIFLYVQGSHTWVHYFAWKYLPFASSFRGPGRISLMLPMLLMLVLTWIIRAKPFSLKLRGKTVQIAPHTILAAAGLLLTIGYVYASDLTVRPFPGDGIYSATKIRNIPLWTEQTILSMGMLSLTVLTIHGLLLPIQSRTASCFQFSIVKRGSAEALLCLLACLQIMGLLYYGTWMESKKDKPGFSQMLAEKQKKLDYHADLPGFGLCTAAVVQQARRSYLEPFLGKIYTRHINARDNEDAYALMKQGRTPDQVVIEQYEPNMANEDRSFISEADPDLVKLTYSSFNRVVFEVRAAHSGFFGFSPPFTKNWKAFVNGQGTRVYRANGASHAIRIPAGASRVEFRYWSPAAFWGMMLSGVSLMVVAFVFAFRISKKSLRVWIIGMAILLSVGGFSLWHRSLYAGDNLGSAYAWTSQDALSRPSNLAYSKQTKMSSYLYLVSYPYISASGRGVDGDRSPKSGFRTRLQFKPWWIADLHRPERIGSIILYESRQRPQYNIRPLSISFTNDQKNWETRLVNQSDTPLRVVFEQPITARYVLVQASGTCQLSFDEVEIYPPGLRN